MMKEVLVTDDNDLCRETMALVLQTEGYAVRTAPDVDSAIEAIREHQFDLIISDYRMPGKSGLDLLQHVRSDHCNVPFLMVSASDDICLKSAATLLGAFSLLQKPFRKSDLITMASRAIASVCDAASPVNQPAMY